MNITIEETAAKLKEANSFVITAHVNPDGDAIGSCLGMMHVLKALGKQVKVLIDDDFDKNFHVLPGYEEIEKPEADSYEADYLLLLDASTDRCGRVIEKCSAPVLNIDHHVSNDGKADFLCLNAKAAACTEVLYSVLKAMEIDPNLEAATCLYTGLATDSGYFRYSNTTPYTMRAAADLMEKGIHPELISQALETRSFEHVSGLGKALETIEMAENGKIAGIYLGYDVVSQLESTEGFIDIVRIIEGVDVTVFVKEVEKNLCRVSMRSKYADVSAVALSLGGGGHIRAAGCSLNMPLVEAKATVLAALHQAIQEKG